MVADSNWASVNFIEWTLTAQGVDGYGFKATEDAEKRGKGEEGVLGQ